MLPELQFEPVDPRTRACINSYANKLDQIIPGTGDNVRSHPLVPATKSPNKIVLGAGFGTTATTSLNKALGMMSMNAHHMPWSLRYIIQALRGCRRGAFYFKTQQACFSQPACRKMWFLGCNITTIMPEVQRDQCLDYVRNFDYTSVTQGGVNAITDTPVAELFIDLFLTFPNARVILTTRNSVEWVQSRKKHHAAHWPVQEPCGLQMNRAPLLNDKKYAKFFDLHSELVRCLVPAERLLEFDVKTDSPERMQGLMGEIAAFLGLKFPGGLEYNITDWLDSEEEEGFE